MAENIFKIYDQNLWQNESNSDRFNHVITTLSRYDENHPERDYDWKDLVWHIKNAVIGNIYFSQVVYDGIISKKYWQGNQDPKKDYYDWICRISKGQTLLRSGIVDESLLKIRERLNSRISFGELRFEHMIPAKVYLKHLYKVYKSGKLTQEYFIYFRKKINVCIVTKRQDDRLNKAGLREEMPQGASYNFDKDAPDSRYIKVGIQIHNWPNLSPIDQ